MDVMKTASDNRASSRAGTSHDGGAHCLTVDVEEHFHVSAFDSPIRRRHWPHFESRVETNTHKVLELLAARKVRATFFVLGWVAERHHQLVRDIAAAGHEIASHGYAHELVTSQTPAAFREDVKKAKAILEDVIGTPVLGYRAPSFSVSKETSWVLPVLQEEGHVYDSSIFPIVHDRYGWPGADPFWHEIDTPGGTIWEVPPATVNVGGTRIPIAGGGYLRLFPYWLLRGLLSRAVTQGSRLVMYVHPWELDPQQPRMNGPLWSRFRHYVNLHKTEARLGHLLEELNFVPIREVISHLNTVGSPRPAPQWAARAGRPSTAIGVGERKAGETR